MPFSSVRIKNLEITPALVLAPMSGVTCSAFRRLCRRLNGRHLGLVITEFISIEALTRSVRRTLEMMRFRPEERPIGIQLFGYDSDRMAEAARLVEQCGADLLEINCGCPAPKVVRKGGGCDLMRKPAHLAEILRKVRQATALPLTVKMRSGYDMHSRNAVEIARICEVEGVDGLAVHGRTRSQLYRGEADWEIVREVAASVAVPVLGSGDIVTRETALRKPFAQAPAAEAGAVAGLYIGRAALANPFIFEEICTGQGRGLRQNQTLVLEILKHYSELLNEDFHDKVSCGRIKQLASQMCKGYPWRKELLLTKTFIQQLQIIDDLQQRCRTEVP